MEEILASIRRIISDDEQNSARQPAASPASQQDDDVLEMVEVEADDKIINDIARVLSGAQQTPAEEEEEVLDLTSELGGLEIVEEEEILVAEIVAEPEVIEAPAPEIFQPAPAQIQAEAEAEQELKAEIQAEAEAQAEAPELAPAPAPAAPMSASDEAASALERAIAALRAGQLPTSISEFGAQPEPQPQLEPAPTPHFTAHEPEPPLEPAPEFAAEPEPEPEPDLVLAEFEAEAIAEEPVFVEPEPISEPEAIPAWESETAPWAEPEPAIEPEWTAPRTNGHSDHDSDGGQKSLEDSVKDMLRPMLQRWLDENMTRVLAAALHDELRDNPSRFQRD
jgi:cell pole-organizing protein PopZ